MGDRARYFLERNPLDRDCWCVVDSGTGLAVNCSYDRDDMEKECRLMNLAVTVSDDQTWAEPQGDA